VFVQFSDSIGPQGAPTYRIGTTSAAEVNLEDCPGCGISGWGWQDNGYGAGVLGPALSFASDAPQTIRVQTREDGMMIDQILLSADGSTAPGALKLDTTVLRETTADGEEPPPSGAEIVLHASSASLTGNWILQPDTTAAGGFRMWNPNAGLPKRTTALDHPSDYAELTFVAEAGRGYRVWIRGKAETDHWSNDSVHVQFSGSVDGGGSPVFRIGTTQSTEYNLESCSGCGLSGWGWEDNGWGVGALGPLVYFAADGPQTIRLQTREDGLSIDQIVLSPEAYLNSSPGAAKNDTVILPASSPGVTPTDAGSDVVLHTADATVAGNWQLMPDATAASGHRAWNPDTGAAKRTTALADPAGYIELTFTAEARRAYRMWIRGKAENDHWGNDSAHVQFSGSVDVDGNPVNRIGTNDSTEYNLEACSGCGMSSWGWDDNGWGSGVLGPLIYFQTNGPQTIRLQTREDGLSVDQIILSPARFMAKAPGAPKNDRTIYP
jgi:hypothetical protein